MSNIEIQEKEEIKKKVKPLFESALDLAISCNQQWSLKNLHILLKLDDCINFILDDHLFKKKRNLIQKFFYKRKIKDYKDTADKFSRELLYLQIEIENLIGPAMFRRAGLKNKIKNKKEFDDKVIEYREITVMIGGILSININETDYDFENEISILNQIKKENEKKNLGYYTSFSVFLTLFRF